MVPNSSQTRYVRFTSSVKSNFCGGIRIQITSANLPNRPDSLILFASLTLSLLDNYAKVQSACRKFEKP